MLVVSSASTTSPPDAARRAGGQHGIGLEDFQAAVNASFVPLVISTRNAQRFSGLLKAGSCGELHITDVRATDHVVERTPELIARSDRAYYKGSVMLAGRGLLVQDGREALLAPGNIAIYDTSRPYTLVFDDAFRTLVVMFPKHLVGLPGDLLAPLTAVAVDTTGGLGCVVASHLLQLGANLDQLQDTTGARLAHGALDLVTTLFLRELGLDDTGGDPHRELFGRICDYIEQNLGSSELGPGAVAAAHYISTRHLHAVFNEQGTTVSTWIRARRLEQCRRDLIDPRYAERTVGAIAARWGFADAAHFSRAFKSAFELSPRDYRATR